MLVPNRHANTPEYKYGFNGMEMDDELKGEGNSYDFGARILDTRIGRFLSLDPEAMTYSGHTPYGYVRNNPILRVDPTGKWDIEVHVYKDREKWGYGIAIVKDRHGKEIFRYNVRVEGTAGRNRMITSADTPLGVYDIPDKNMWKSGGSRQSYGPNPRLILTPESGEILTSKRDLIRQHGGRQEIYDEENGWTPVANPKLGKTEGCIRAFDSDQLELKRITDKLTADDSKEFGGKYTVIDDLVEKDGEYMLPVTEKAKTDLRSEKMGEIFARIVKSTIDNSPNASSPSNVQIDNTRVASPRVIEGVHKDPPSEVFIPLYFKLSKPLNSVPRTNH